MNGLSEKKQEKKKQEAFGVLCDKRITMRLSYKSVVRPTILHGLEYWIVYKKIK